MTAIKPYQPLVLRLLHGVNSLIIILCLLTGFLVYNTFDGRFGKLPLPHLDKIIDLHGTFAKVFLLVIMPLFVLYSFHIGQRRLINDNSLSHLKDIDKPIGWYNLHRLVNTGLLLAITLAVVSGGKMKESWLPNGDFHHTWYVLHLLSWLILLLGIMAHLFMAIKVGGLPFLLSIIDWGYRPEDSPAKWPEKIRSFLNRS